MGRTDAYRLLSALLILLACRLASAEPNALHFEIPAGEAQKTLLQFVAQANIEALYSSQDVRGVTTRAISGNYTVVQALTLMTEGTGLEISFERDFTFASITAAGGRRSGRAKSHTAGADETRV